MKSREDFWDAVNASLDARRDPLADERVRAWIVEHPEDLLPLAKLREDLRSIAPRPRRALWLSAAAVLAVGVLVWRTNGSGTATLARSEILDYSLIVTRETPDTRTTTTLENGLLTRRREERRDSPLFAATITTSKEGLR